MVPGARLAPLESLGLPSMHGSAASARLAARAGRRRARRGVDRALARRRESWSWSVSLPTACAAERIPVGRRAGTALLLSGAIAGLAAIAPVLGYKGYYESGLGAGAGFAGIAVALLGRRSVVGLVLAALFFGTLEQGGLAINARVPMEVTTVLQAVAIVAVALADVRAGALARMASAASMAAGSSASKVSPDPRGGS